MVAITAASLGTAFADSCANSFSGFYAGVQAGVNSTNGTTNIDNYLATNSDTAASNHKSSVGKKSFVGGLFAGYGMGVGSCAYVGAELYANFGNSNDTAYDSSNYAADSKNLKITVKRGYTMGAKVRLGYTVSPQAMIFLGLGLERAKMTLQSENMQTAHAQTGAKAVKKSKNKVSFAPSVGMDMFLNKNLFLRGEYTYVVGTSQKVSPVVTNTVGTNFTATVKTNMTQQRFALGLGYKF